MNCQHCGGTLEPDAKFCTVCGKSMQASRIRDTGYRKPWKILAVVVLVLLSGVLFLIPGIRSMFQGSLSRSMASSLIMGSNETMKIRSIIKLNEDGYQKGIAENIWDSTQAKPTTQGLKFLQPDSTCYSYTYLKKPAEIQLEITGITNSSLGEQIKEAQFTWKYTEVPAIIKRFVVNGGYGSAYFRKYDDGWRMDEMHYQYSDQPAQLTQEELAEEQAEVAAIEREAQARAEAERAEQARLAQLLLVSKTQTKQLAHFDFEWRDNLYTNYVSLNISDVGVDFTTIKKAYGSITTNDYIWYGDITNIIRDTSNRNYAGFPCVIEVRRRSSYGEIYTDWYFSDKAIFEQVWNELVSARQAWINNNVEVVQKNLR